MRSAASTSPSALKRFFAGFHSAFSSFPAETQIVDVSTVHHLRSVLRAKPGERLVVVDAERRMAYDAVIQDLSKASVQLLLERILPASRDSLPMVTLAVSLIKEQRWDWMLQKATELGVSAIQPLITERSVIRLEDAAVPKKLERWRAVLRSAAEQSEGLFIPEIYAPLTLDDFLHTSGDKGLRLLLQERGENRKPLKAALRQMSPEQTFLLAVGPEGGWSPAELSAFEQADFTGVSLGQRILRAETAAIAALSALVYEYGD